jgi:hypothetical protein
MQSEPLGDAVADAGNFDLCEKRLAENCGDYHASRYDSHGFLLKHGLLEPTPFISVQTPLIDKPPGEALLPV